MYITIGVGDHFIGIKVFLVEVAVIVIFIGTLSFAVDVDVDVVDVVDGKQPEPLMGGLAGGDKKSGG